MGPLAAKLSGTICVPLWPPSAAAGVRLFFYNIMICGHIIVRIIAYYHIAELSAHASWVVVDREFSSWKSVLSGVPQ